MAISLSNATLSSLPASVSVPSYDRAALRPGIVHFGVGNFHRSHQAMYLDRLFNMGLDHDWALIGAGVFAGEAKGRDVLAKQDWLCTLVEQEADSSSARVLGSMIDFLPPADAPAIIDRMSQPDIRIVSLTITEGGYFLDSADRFDPSVAAIVADAQNPSEPTTVFGMMLAALQARRAAGVAPFTVMSCDNIPHNGNVTRNALVGLARLFDGDLADWIVENVAFPNGMVDRITPATSDRERGILLDEHGVVDGWPVFCEDFAQWVLEDNFPLGRPALEEAGVQFVKDVAPFELMKLRILNGGHAVIAYPAGLLDIHFAHEAMAHPLIRAFFRKVEETDILPTIPPVPNTDTTEYLSLIERRFSNPKIGDTITRLCLDGANRQPKFIVPVVRSALEAGGCIDGLALESALWCRYCLGTTDSGAEIAANDPRWEELTLRATAAVTRPEAWLEMSSVYGDLSNNDQFSEAFTRWRNMLGSEGTEATLTAYTQTS